MNTHRCVESYKRPIKLRSRAFVRLIGLSVLLAGLIVLITPALAQDASQLVLKLNRDFGYSSGTGQIQAFSMRVSGPESLVRVEFLIDGNTIGEATAPPFNLRFDTGQFDLGTHSLSANGYTADGTELN